MRRGRRWLLLVATATVLGVVGGLGVTVLGSPTVGFACDDINVVAISSWRGFDTLPDTFNREVGSPLPMFYTTEEQGGPPTGGRPTGVWAPGDRVQRVLNVRNNSTDVAMVLKGMRVLLNGDTSLAGLMTLSVIDSYSPTPLFSGTFEQFVTGQWVVFQTGLTVLESATETLTFVVSFDRAAGNEYQGKTLHANFEIGADPLVYAIVIDAHPSSWPNPINPDSKGNIPVAVNGGKTMNVRNLDWRTARFGPNLVPPLRAGSFSDWNHDGYTDLVLHFPNQGSGITCGMTSVTLHISSFDGAKYEGSDVIKTPPCP